VGWLVVEDLVMVLVLVLLPALAGLLTPAGAAAPVAAAGDGFWFTLLRTLLAVSAFVALMLLVGRRLLPWLLWHINQTGSRELFTLAVVASAVSIAYGAAALFGVSVALGAFFAGLVLRESEFSHRAAEESLPFRDAFAVLFFVSVGMLFDPAVLVERPGQVLAVAAIVMLGKSLAAAALVLALRYPLNSALTVSASLAQIGEFSFILVALGGQLNLLPPEAQSLVVAGAMLSIALNPLLFEAVAPLQRWVLARSALARRLEARDDPLAELPQTTEARFLARQVVLVGHGRVGARVAAGLSAAGVPLVVVDRQREQVQGLRERGHAAVLGDATEPMVLVQAHVATAGTLVVALAETRDVALMIAHARRLNPALHIVVRSPNEEESQLLLRAGASQAVQAEHTLADELLLQALKPQAA
jgi:CPA2 family monovalent cation:H+ antiporter-2